MPVTVPRAATAAPGSLATLRAINIVPFGIHSGSTIEANCNPGTNDLGLFGHIQCAQAALEVTVVATK